MVTFGMCLCKNRSRIKETFYLNLAHKNSDKRLMRFVIKEEKMAVLLF